MKTKIFEITIFNQWGYQELLITGSMKNPVNVYCNELKEKENMREMAILLAKKQNIKNNCSVKFGHKKDDNISFLIMKNDLLK